MKHLKQSGRIARGVLAGFSFQATTVVIQILGVAILLRAWGAAKYGEWLVLFAIPSYLSVTDLGFSQSAGNDMCQLVARNDHKQAQEVFHTLAAVVVAATVIGIAVTTAVVFALPLSTWLKLSQLGDDSSRCVLWLLATTMLVALTDWACHAAFRATGDYAFHLNVLAGTRLAQHAGIWVTALAGGQPTAAAFAFLVVQIAGTLLTLSLLSKRHPEFRFSIANRRRGILRRLATPAVANISFPIAQALNIQGMVIVVGAVLGPVSVVTFSTLRTLTRLIVQLVIVVSHASEPELAAAYGVADLQRLRTIFLHSLRMALWLATSAGLALLAFGPFVLRTWTRGRVTMDSSLFCWLSLSAIASVLWYGPLTLLRAANVHIRAAVLYSFAAATALALAGLAMRARREVADAGLSLLLVDLVMAAYVLRAASRLLSSPVRDILATAVNPIPLLPLSSPRPTKPG